MCDVDNVNLCVESKYSDSMEIRAQILISNKYEPVQQIETNVIDDK